MHSIAVFCGSNTGCHADYLSTAKLLGEILAKNHCRLIYGGANVGMMKAIADSCLAHGGQVTGVIPRFLQTKEIAHTNLTELHIVESMHERKALMTKLSEGFIALPGGAGTLDELFEIWTWQQLGLHTHPIGLLNCQHFFDKLFEFLKHNCEQGFLKKSHLDNLWLSDNPHQLLAHILSRPSINADEKWLNLEKS